MKIQDYLHLYFGCPCIFRYGPTGEWKDGFIKEVALQRVRHGAPYEVKPILRPLRHMTDEELQTCGNMVYDFSDDPELNNHKWRDFEIGLAAEQFHWLLSKHFDLFGLIAAGLAIDATTIFEHEQKSVL